MTGAPGPRIPTAEEEVLKTSQCEFESHRGHHVDTTGTRHTATALDRETRTEITAATTQSRAALNHATA